MKRRKSLLCGVIVLAFAFGSVSQVTANSVDDREEEPTITVSDNFNMCINRNSPYLIFVKTLQKPRMVVGPGVCWVCCFPYLGQKNDKRI